MRLPRPHIPLKIRCLIVLRQLGEMWPHDVIQEWRANPTVAPEHRPTYGKLLAERLRLLAALLRCELADLRLDHDPPLGAREKVFKNGEHVGYKPGANDPEHLFYRPHGTGHAGSHDVKTRIRGDHGQFSDVALIKRARRRERKPAQKPGARPTSSKSPKTGAQLKHRAGKRRWPSRPFPKRNRREP